MKRLSLLVAIAILIVSSALSQQKPAYKIYHQKGRKTAYKKLVRKISKADVVFFGELHNDPISHWLQLELSKDLAEERDLLMGAEMFEADNQEALDRYLTGKIDQNGLDSLARLWPNYKTDYAPLVEFAKENSIRFIATNIPRRYASAVYKMGGFGALDSLSAQEKSWIAPLPIPFDPQLPGYQNMLEMMGDHGSMDMVKAQAIKDATMAHFISKNYLPEHLFFHFNGAYHSNNHEGIYWYLKKYRPQLDLITISMVVQKDVKTLEENHKGLADFIICVDENMTKTY